MPKPKKPKEKPCLSRFMLMRQHRRLSAEKQAKDARVRELTRVRDNARENATTSGKGWDKEQRALDKAERGPIFINQKIMEIKRKLGSPQN